MNQKVVCLAATLFAGSLQLAAARTIHVCTTCAYTSVQAAVDDAVNDDVIAIAAGRYTEGVLIEGKHLTLIGAGGGTQGISELAGGARHGPTLVLGSGNPGDPYHLIEIHDLTITHGNHLTGSAVGGGVQVRAGAYLHIFDSTISQNVANQGGGIGINTPNGPETTITRCLISENLALSAPNQLDTHGGGVAVVAGSATIRQSTISRNETTGQYGGGGIYSEGNLSLSNSTVSDNRANSIIDSSGVSGGNGGGLLLTGDFVISGTTITNNTASGEASEGGGLAIGFYDSGTHSIENSVISHNFVTGGFGTAFGNGGGIYSFSGFFGFSAILNLSHVYVVENLAGGGLFNTQGVTLRLIDTTIKDNAGGNCVGPGCPP
jgi:hypothetical protein